MSPAAALPAGSLPGVVGASKESTCGILCHMEGAEWIWLERWNGRSPAKAEAWSQWTTESCPDLATLRGRWMDVVGQRGKYVSGLDEARLRDELEFKLLSGDASSMRLMDQMQHVA